jgi:tetraacyldisaccharide-1-P 4'-kinase
VGTRAFPDHHLYTPSDLVRLDAWVSRTRPDIVLTTQKDLVKLPVSGLAGCPVYALQIELCVTEGSEVLSRSLELLLADGPEVARAA